MNRSMSDRLFHYFMFVMPFRIANEIRKDANGEADVIEEESSYDEENGEKTFLGRFVLDPGERRAFRR